MGTALRLPTYPTIPHIQLLSASWPGSAQVFDAIVFNHRVGEDVASDGIEIRARIESDLEVFPLPDIVNSGVAQAYEGGADGLALRVQDGRLQSDVHARFHLLGSIH